MAKKGKSSGVLVRMVYLPIYYPLCWAFWFTIDIVGGGVIPGAKKLMQYQLIKNGVGFLKELRLVLQQYLAFPRAPAPEWRCKNCPMKAHFWCVDCSKKLCPQCTVYLHAPGSFCEQHSVEELTENWKREGVHLLSPILPEIIATLVFTWIFNNVDMISEDYLTRANMCPVVDIARESSAHLDPHLFYWYKASFMSWCNYEDSFWKLLTDTWVRGLVTETDSSLLVFVNLPQALLFEVVVVIIMVPIFSLIYALLLNAVYSIELCLPKTDGLQKIERIINFFDITNAIGSSQMDSSAPETKHRRRKSTDFMDYWTYWYQRKMKYFNYFYNTASQSMKYFAWQVTMALVSFRLICAWLGLGGYIRDLLAALGWQMKIATHQMWFQDAAGRMLVTEDSLWGVASMFSGIAQYLIANVPDPIMQSSWCFLKMLCVVWILVAFAIISVSIFIVKQRRAFNVEWKAGDRDVALAFLQENCLEEEKVKVPKTIGGRCVSMVFGKMLGGA